MARLEAGSSQFYPTLPQADLGPHALPALPPRRVYYQPQHAYIPYPGDVLGWGNGSDDQQAHQEPQLKQLLSEVESGAVYGTPCGSQGGNRPHRMTETAHALPIRYAVGSRAGTAACMANTPQLQLLPPPLLRQDIPVPPPEVDHGQPSMASALGGARAVAHCASEPQTSVHSWRLMRPAASRTLSSTLSPAAPAAAAAAPGADPAPTATPTNKTLPVNLHPPRAPPGSAMPLPAAPLSWPPMAAKQSASVEQQLAGGWKEPMCGSGSNAPFLPPPRPDSCAVASNCEGWHPQPQPLPEVLSPHHHHHHRHLGNQHGWWPGGGTPAAGQEPSHRYHDDAPLGIEATRSMATASAAGGLAAPFTCLNVAHNKADQQPRWQEWDGMSLDLADLDGTFTFAGTLPHGNVASMAAGTAVAAETARHSCSNAGAWLLGSFLEGVDTAKAGGGVICVDGGVGSGGFGGSGLCRAPQEGRGQGQGLEEDCLLQLLALPPSPVPSVAHLLEPLVLQGQAGSALCATTAAHQDATAAAGGA
jgi:hypothetical protein